MRRHKAGSARLVQTLVFFDGPQLLYFETDNDLPMLAVAVGNPSPGKSLFFACEMNARTFQNYKMGKVDLNFVFRYANNRKMYIFNLEDMEDDVITLYAAPEKMLDNDRFYPERGFFEEDHTEEWAGLSEPASKRQLGIAGRWEASDFSRFYGKIGDTYSFLSLVDDLGSPEATKKTKREIIDMISEPSFRGGGSYVGFYSDMKSLAQEVRPLRISSIEYHSPGYIEVEGRQRVFSELENSIASLVKSFDEVRSLSSEISKILTSEDLKRSGRDADFSNNKIKAIVLRRARKLGLLLNICKPNIIYRATDRNVLVFAKIMLSYYRRVRDLVMFEQQGRITFEGLGAANSPSTGATQDAPVKPRRS